MSEADKQKRRKRVGSLLRNPGQRQWRASSVVVPSVEGVRFAFSTLPDPGAEAADSEVDDAGVVPASA